MPVNCYPAKFRHLLSFGRRGAERVDLRDSDTLIDSREILLGMALVLGAFTRVAAFLSGWLLLLFALSMTFALGLKAPLNFSVFTASAAAFLLATCRKYSWSLDSLRKQREGNPMKMQASMPAIILMTVG